MPRASSGERDMLLLLVLLPLLCGCCSRSSLQGRLDMYSYAFAPRAPPGLPAPSVVPEASSGVHDVLQLYLPYVVGADPRVSMVIMQDNPSR